MTSKQVFYVQDRQNSKWKIVILISPRDMYNMAEAVMDADGVLECPSSIKDDDVVDFNDIVIESLGYFVSNKTNNCFRMVFVDKVMTLFPN